MIQVKNLNKQFNGEYLFTEFNLSVNKGEMIAITGKSGSGKSTLLACMCGLEKFDKGKIEINKRNIANMKQKDKVLNMSI